MILYCLQIVKISPEVNIEKGKYINMINATL